MFKDLNLFLNIMAGLLHNTFIINSKINFKYKFINFKYKLVIYKFIIYIKVYIYNSF